MIKGPVKNQDWLLRSSKLIYLLLFVVVKVNAQFAAPVKDSLESAALHEKREIAIILPANYTTDTTRYDVWYVLDGEWNSTTFAHIFNFEVAIGFAPPAIIVSVPNRYVNGFNLRDRDFTPTYWKDIDSSGGAGHFLDFFERELMPYIKSKYRTSGESGLFGTSLGGLFTMYVLLQKPSLFRFYTMGDPALQFDDKLIPHLASNKLKQMTFQNTVLNIGGRSGFSYADMGRDVMDSILRSDAPPGLNWHSALYEDETHGSSVFKSNYDGIKYAYLGYSARNAVFHLTSGIVLQDHPVRLFVPTDHADMHYTTDGREPEQRDKKVDEFLLVSEPGKLKVKSFSPSGRYNRLLPMGLRSGDYIVPVKLPAKKRSPIKLNNTTRKDGAGLINGYVTVPKDGYYVFQLTPAAGTRLYFNDSLIVSADAATQVNRQTIILPLRKGNYPLRFEQPSKDLNEHSLNFGFYYSENGQDDWWRNPLLRW